jgi:hypothetical protein
MPDLRSLGMIDLPRPLTEQEEIESLAYRLFEDKGKPEGRAEEHWLILVILLILLLMGRI